MVTQLDCSHTSQDLDALGEKAIRDYHEWRKRIIGHREEIPDVVEELCGRLGEST